ncbi:protein suppressor of sable [Drosophila busckii]|nr:protein suppressor of sable [Drosophila busckii]
MSIIMTGDTPVIDLADDLEDGEIDDDDDDEEQKDTTQKVAQPEKQQQQQLLKPTPLTTTGNSSDEVLFVSVERLPEKLSTATDDDVVYVGMSNDMTNTANAASSNKSKKPRPLEDDHAVNIENAIANALKKSGIEPPMPKIHNSTNSNISINRDVDNAVNANGADNTNANNNDGSLSAGQGPSRSSRRRKRKKEREREQRKDKEHQKRARRDSMDESAGPAGSEDMDDMDEYEMMNVRGGSPPPGGGSSSTGGAGTQTHYPSDWPELGDGVGLGYESMPDNYSSYDSYSDDEPVNVTACAPQRRRQRREREKETRGGRKRRDRDRDRERDGDRRHDGGGGGGGNNKRNRRDSDSEKIRSEPRKLELCKFYLKDCCAKREKCSYMHKEFPCKYYYLGMECYAGDECLFHHGEPLSEQLRNILLKHMETAPKEILGDFKRIARDVALTQLTRRHEQLCEQFGVDNSWTTYAGAGISHRLQDQQQQQQVAKAAATAAVAVSQAAALAAAVAASGNQKMAAGGTTAIPSLLDMVINPPLSDAKAEKKRKSRWAEKGAAAKSTTATVTTTAVAPIAAAAVAPMAAAPIAAAAAPAKPLPAHLDLVNLAQVLSAEHMGKLNKLGISNLEQMMQVPFGQLTEAGLTLPEIGEIQRMAEQSNPNEVAKSSPAETSTKTEREPANNTPATASTLPASTNSNSNSNNGFIMVDYTQYLKDAHVTEQLDDDHLEDDEQLVIDVGNEEEDDETGSDTKSKSKCTEDEQQTNTEEPKKPPEAEDEDAPPLPSVFDLPTFMSNMLGQQQLIPQKSEDTPTPAEKSPERASSYATTATVTPNEISSPSGVFNNLLFDGKQDPEARAAFYRDIIRNPFKANLGDAGPDDSNDNYSFGQHSNSNSRSLTPTPEAGSRSPSAANTDEPLLAESTTPSLYTRASMYDYDEAKAALEDARASEDPRGRDRDVDMRLPFEPMMHYMPATEIDAAIFSHVPLRWRLQVVFVEPPNFALLRQAASHKEQCDLRDPRLRRILGLSELSFDEGSIGSASSSGASSIFSVNTFSSADRRERATSNCISSPDGQQFSYGETTPSSPPPSMMPPLPAMNVPPPTLASAESTDPRRTDPRRDPRRAHLNSASSNSVSSFSGATTTIAANDCSRQILEIRNLLQSSNWYKNLGSNNKILVNQQLALVFTELKKFHQQDGASKIFDVNFIVNNQTLQQIFAKLHIYIDDNGLVVQLPEEPPNQTPLVVPNMGPILPNMSQPPPNLAQLLCQPPPNVARMLPMGMQGISPFNQPPPAAAARANSILGMPPPNGPAPGGINNNHFNPFAGGNNLNALNNLNNLNLNNLNNMGMNNMNMNMRPGFNGCGGPGPGPGPGPFKNFGPGNNNGNGNQGHGRHFVGGGGNNRNRSGSGNRNRNN